MRNSALAIVAIVAFNVPSLFPVAAWAQQAGPDTTQVQNDIRRDPDTQQSDRARSQDNPATPERSQQSQTQSTPVQPERTPQQSDETRDRERRSAEETRINRDWTTRQRSEDRMDNDRPSQRRMGRMMDQDDDHRTMGRNSRRDEDDIDRGRGFGFGERNEGRSYYEIGPRPRVKTCFEYENGDEFCRYRD
ncbi:hypothetical protein [Bradyrhizobium sp. 76]|uniref:hypothetical protein n=1 Tax=Bradyrhizobium sp. 76 TaxID=2782680 RepID=UPI001FF9FDD9|nr:hypothetical protein [Bradyrhizobium sp. 76]MCK1405300.1 hypothetical protein [Bradyrhizobium sp. 76]